MMNKRIRSMIDEIFSEMKMTAENLALRDELLANAQARYEDVIAGGKSEEEAFAEVAASLEDVHELLHEMNSGDEAAQEPAKEAAQESAREADKAEPAQEIPKAGELDLGETLNKAFSALGSFGKSIMPQAKKLVRDMDDATGGKLGDMGRAMNKSVRDAQKAAGDTIDKMSDMTGELVFDFGKRKDPDRDTGAEDACGEACDLRDEASDLQDEASDLRDEVMDLREEAADLRAEAGFKAVTGDKAGADELYANADALEAKADMLSAQVKELNEKADALCTQADALEQAQAMEEAARAAAQEVETIVLEEEHEPLLDEDGDVNEDAFTKVVEQIERDAKQMTDDAADAGDEAAQDAAYTVNGEATASGSLLFPAAGLRAVDIELDADDVRIEAAEGNLIETIWSAQNVEGEPEIVMEGHRLRIRRKNPDVFKTFFSVFSKNGGQITVRVPRGYAAEYKIGTTSGDIIMDEVDVESVKANTTSGGIRLEPDASVRCVLVKADTVSGDVTVSACAEEVKVNTVSGRQFISCDADKVKADTVSGRVHIEGACDTWDVDSVSGNVELVCADVPGRKIDIDTVSASATVALPGSIRGFVAKFSGMGGRLVNEFGPERYGTCALPVHMDSMSGSLRITRI